MCQVAILVTVEPRYKEVGYFCDVSLPLRFCSFMKYNFARIASCHPSKSKLPFYPDLLSYQLWFLYETGPWFTLNIKVHITLDEFQLQNVEFVWNNDEFNPSIPNSLSGRDEFQWQLTNLNAYFFNLVDKKKKEYEWQFDEVEPRI